MQKKYFQGNIFTPTIQTLKEVVKLGTKKFGDIPCEPLK